MKQPYKMETVRSVCQAILVHDWTVSIDLMDAHLTCSNSSSTQKVSLVHVPRSGLSVHGLTLRNVTKSLDFYQTDGHYSIAPASACHLSISLTRGLAYKRSNSQSVDISHQILPPNSTKSRFYSKSKEVRFNSSPEIHVSGERMCAILANCLED